MLAPGSQPLFVPVVDQNGRHQSILMEVEITKGTSGDLLQVRRGNGSIAKTDFPKKGLLPHDAIHLVVESELQMKTGFWGRVAAGATPEEVGAVAIAGGHRSSSRAQTPLEEIVELIQAERIVECFEAEMWSEPSSVDTFIGVLDAACAQSRVKCPKLSEQNILRIRTRLNALFNRWQKLEIGESLVLSWS